ncbi:MAG: hypothetical protein M5U12_35150 [Verrucomicrobia bacterium]|nr:hypothetical protein [Verrucomicrobiota bacterium]
MLASSFTAAGLVAITVAVHAAGFALVLRSFMRSHATPPTQFWPIEGLTGILMCGLSAGFLFALVTRIYSSRRSPKPNPA